MQKILFFLLTLMGTVTVFAQDIHFSQFWMQPLYQNPGNAGMFNGDYRVGGMFRKQWRVVPVPYSTVSFMGDARFNAVLSEQSALGAGLIFNNDISGDSRYTINQFYVPVSHIQNFSSDTNLTLSFGLMPGISNLSFKTNKLSFDNQFDGDAYNSSLPSGENFPTYSRTYFDLAGGFTGQYKIKNGGYISIGTALSHFHRPDVSFFKNSEVRLYTKSNSFLSIKFPLGQKLALHGDLMYEKQGPFHETIIAGRVSYLLNPTENVALYGGLSSRPGDAFSFMIGMDYKTYRVGLAYDINTSKFIAATNRRGAFEVGILKIINKKPVFKPKKRSCPIYM